MWVSPIAIQSLAQPHQVKWEGGCFSNLIGTDFANWLLVFCGRFTILLTVLSVITVSWICTFCMYIYIYKFDDNTNMFMIYSWCYYHSHHSYYQFTIISFTSLFSSSKNRTCLLRSNSTSCGGTLQSPRCGSDVVGQGGKCQSSRCTRPACTPSETDILGCPRKLVNG